MKLSEVIQQPGQKERLLREDIFKSLHVACPGEIVSYNPKERTAVIQPTVRDGDVKPPQLVDVPVFFCGYFLFEPQKGDECLVVFSDACIDGWFQNGGVSKAITDRKHDMSDGFAFVGFASQSKKKKGFDLFKAIKGKKNKQTAVIDPLPEGEAISFIDSISQDCNGVIMPTKKTIPNATTDAPGLMSAEDKTLLADLLSRVTAIENS